MPSDTIDIVNMCANVILALTALVGSIFAALSFNKLKVQVDALHAGTRGRLRVSMQAKTRLDSVSGAEAVDCRKLELADLQTLEREWTEHLSSTKILASAEPKILSIRIENRGHCEVTFFSAKLQLNVCHHRASKLSETKSKNVSIRENIDLLPGASMLLDVIDIRSFPIVTCALHEISYSDTYGKPTSVVPVQSSVHHEFEDPLLVPQTERALDEGPSGSEDLEVP